MADAMAPGVREPVDDAVMSGLPQRKLSVDDDINNRVVVTMSIVSTGVTPWI
jgi:hypothetical protein